ncbi:hypothetical protein KAI56_03730 [Candidatus Parcubacteria bacterium]|nr:hypothetical protein [Candidatus Parcubacteria bacterium]
MAREIKFIDLAELEETVEKKESERTMLEETIKEAIAFLNFKHCDIGTFYINSETCTIYLTPIGHVTEKVSPFLPFISKDEIPLIEVGELILKLPAIKIRIPEKEEKEYP